MYSVGDQIYYSQGLLRNQRPIDGTWRDLERSACVHSVAPSPAAPNPGQPLALCWQPVDGQLGLSVSRKGETQPS